MYIVLFGLKNKLLVELFAGTKPRKLYVNINIRLKPRKLYKLFGKREYLYRLSHIKHEYLSALCKSAGLNNKLCCLRYSHKVTGYVGMRYSKRSAVFKLFFEKRYYAAV